MWKHAGDVTVADSTEATEGTQRLALTCALDSYSNPFEDNFMWSGPPRNYWAWSSIPWDDSLESKRAIDNDLKLYKVQIRHKKEKTLLFSGGGGKSENQMLFKTPAVSLWPPKWSRLLWLWAHTTYLTVANAELSILCVCSVKGEQTSVEINPGLVKLSPLFQWTP